MYFNLILIKFFNKKLFLSIITILFFSQNISEAETRSLTHGYYAAVSYTDAQIGKVLEALDKQGLSKNTIVIVSSDHGFSLGDHTLWNKHSLFKIATKVPLIVSGPKVEQNAKVSGVAEYVDIYPTIVELADLKLQDQNSKFFHHLY